MERGQGRLVVALEVAALGIRATYLTCRGMENRAADGEFEALKERICRELAGRYTDEFLARDPVMAGFREVRARARRSPRRYPVSIDSLVGTLRRRGSLPSINLAVDIYNLVSLETRLTIGAHDLARVTGDVHLRLLTGAERFTPLGGSGPQRVVPGEYGYVDESGEVLCRLDYKQAESTKVTLETTACFFIVQGNEHTGAAYLADAARRIADLLVRFGLAGPGARIRLGGQPFPGAPAREAR
ncbi:MAG: hypothetical protein Kow0092_11330 [Deferrisomatales bacterium]